VNGSVPLLFFTSYSFDSRAGGGEHARLVVANWGISGVFDGKLNVALRGGTKVVVVVDGYSGAVCFSLVVGQLVIWVGTLSCVWIGSSLFESVTGVDGDGVGGCSEFRVRAGATEKD
jgi:hypothetical protein